MSSEFAANVRQRLEPMSFTVVALMLMLALMSSKCNNPEDCETVGIIRDNSTLDGCGLMIETQKSGLLLPINLYEMGSALLEGDTVALTFHRAKDAMSSCMAEDAIVTLSCLDVISSKSCDEFKDPISIDWARAAVKANNTTLVTQYSSKPRSFYLFSGADGCILYDCTGQLIGSEKCNDKMFADFFTNRGIPTDSGRVIYTINE